MKTFIISRFIVHLFSKISSVFGLVDFRNCSILFATGYHRRFPESRVHWVFSPVAGCEVPGLRSKRTLRRFDGMITKVLKGLRMSFIGLSRKQQQNIASVNPRPIFNGPIRPRSEVGRFAFNPI